MSDEERCDVKVQIEGKVPVGVTVNGFDIPNVVDARIVAEAGQRVRIYINIMPDNIAIENLS